MAYLPLLAIIILALADQLIKNWALDYLTKIDTMQVIPNFLHFTYVENYGAAFGMLTNQKWFLIGITSTAIIAGIIAIIKGVFKNPILLCGVTLIISGGLGNLIDRATRGFVVDYIDINRWFEFPVFNFADCCVVVGTILVMIYILFLDQRNKKSGEKNV